MTADAELLERHAPIVRFNEGEYFLPASVEAFVGAAQLWERTGPATRRLVAEAGTLDVDRLVTMTRGRTAQHFLRLVSEPMGRAELVGWRLDGERPRFRAETRLGRVGVLSRLVDLGGRLSLYVRGRVPTGDEARAALMQRDRPDAGDHPYYARVARNAGYVVLQYWYFYFFNDWRSRAHGVNDHEGDWEQVTIFLTDDDEQTPAWVVFSAHDAHGVDLRRRWDDPDLTLVDGHPVVHAGLGSHAGAFLAGEYLTTVRGTRLRRLSALGTRVSRILLPWTRGQAADGLGIPYVDYKRGDGVSIGTGQERAWRQVVVDDNTPWVRDYSGLWGNDTEDRFGGERGPAGPRYERNGTVRRSWGDPVGWAALDAVIPSGTARQALVDARTAELAGQLAEVQAERDAIRGRLRADVLAGTVDVTAPQTRLAELADRSVVLADQLHRLDLVGDAEPPPVGPHAHLHVRPLPEPVEPAGRRRFLRLWATISTPLLFVLIAFIVASTGRPIASLGAFALVVVFTLEAIARRRFVSFLGTLVAVVITALVVVTVVTALLASWQATLVVVLLAAAIGCLVANLRELIRT